jgi:hypothetical protein
MSTTDRKWRNFNLLLVAIVSLWFFASITINLVIDPYYVFQVSDLGPGFTPNQRFNKVNHVIEHKHTYNAFLLGSSRMGVFPVDKLNAAYMQYNFYNLSVYGGNAKDALIMLRYLKREGINVKKVIIGIDLFPFLLDEDETTPAYRHHPGAINQSTLSFYLNYMFQPSLYHSYIKLLDSHGTTPKVIFDFHNSGRMYFIEKERLIKADQTSFISKNFMRDGRKPVDASFVERRFDDLVNLRDWLTHNNVDTSFFITPHHELELQAFTPNVYKTFLHRVTDILGPIPNFTGYRDWSFNSALYYDKRHFRPVVARQILDILMNPQNQDATSRIALSK